MPTELNFEPSGYRTDLLKIEEIGCGAPLVGSAARAEVPRPKREGDHPPPPGTPSGAPALVAYAGIFKNGIRNLKF